MRKYKKSYFNEYQLIDIIQGTLFKISRIESVEIISEDWQQEAAHQKGFTDIFRMSSYDGSKYPIKLQLNRRAYNLLIEEFPLAERDTQQISDESWILETEVSNYIGPTRFILGLAADIQIIESLELKEYIRDYASGNIKRLLQD